MTDCGATPNPPVSNSRSAIWQIHSVGIDIGTTTSQVIFSRLEVVNRAAASQVPNYEFSRREILYVSPPIVTPMDFEGHVHSDKLQQFVLSQYEAAGVKPEQINSGAIIITGETSKARNARQTIMGLAEHLGDFIVATAGPHLESVIAGQGSGAAEFSRTNSCRVLNIDIGGGTSNYAVFEAGRVVDTACINIGGHLIQYAPDGHILHLHAPAATVAQSLFGNTFSAQQLDAGNIKRIIGRMAELIHEVCMGQPSPLAQSLLMTECLRPGYRYDAVFISGGVGACYYDPETLASPLAFGDIGPSLALALKQHPGMQMLPLREPKHTLRATVIGAGAYSLSLSGSTIWINEQELPIRNLPIVHPTVSWPEVSPQKLAEAWGLAMKRMDIAPGSDSYALALPADMPVAYAQIELCIDAIVHFNETYPDPEHALFIIARQDVGKVLGMLLQPRLGARKLAVIDEVITHDGDYIDIGSPFQGGEIVPITVKSLAFPS